jgi:hypothetical protein
MCVCVGERDGRALLTRSRVCTARESHHSHPTLRQERLEHLRLLVVAGRQAAPPCAPAIAHVVPPQRLHALDARVLVGTGARAYDEAVVARLPWLRLVECTYVCTTELAASELGLRPGLPSRFLWISEEISMKARMFLVVHMRVCLCVCVCEVEGGPKTLPPALSSGAPGRARTARIRSPRRSEALTLPTTQRSG